MYLLYIVYSQQYGDHRSMYAMTPLRTFDSGKTGHWSGGGK